MDSAWRAETPPPGRADRIEVYPRRSPAHFLMSPRYLMRVFGPPNSRDDPYKTFHAWDLTDGSSWVHLYNYRDENSWSMRGDSPGATRAVMAHVYRNYPGRRVARAGSD